MASRQKVDTTQAIKPIIGPLKIPIGFREMLPWILAALAVILIVIAGIWYVRKRKKKEPVFRIKPKAVLPPHERALHELEKLRVKKLWQNGQVKEYHSELTEILRRYIEDRFAVPALEQTSAEIAASLTNHAGCPAGSLAELISLLVLADMVKFAKAKPLATENDASFTHAVEFVRATTGNLEVKEVEND